jgi:serine protease Do
MLRSKSIQIVLFFLSLPLAWMGINLISSSKTTQTSDAFGASTTISTVDANIFVNLAKKIVPSVVNISSFTTVRSPYAPGSPDDILRKFFGEIFPQYKGKQGGEDEEDEENLPRLPGQRLPKAMSLGTGFIIDSSGLILTNNHVVADAESIKISFTESKDEKPSDAEVVGRAPEFDVALVKVKNKREMIPVTFGESDALEVGEYVMAVGNPYGQGHSVTHGIVSAKGRDAPDFPLASYIQTDAPINPGNSGGPLVNLKGEVIGINNAIDQRAQGIGFAIPINIAKKILPQLRTKGTVALGYIGVLVEPLSPEIASKLGLSKSITGPFVTHVVPGGPADKAGVKAYDVIVEFDGKSVKTGHELTTAVTSVEVGKTVKIKIARGKKEETFSIKVSQRPTPQELNRVGEPPRKKPKKAPNPELGMTLEDINSELAKELALKDKAGAVVMNVSYGSAADKAGLIRGDVILEVDRKSVNDVDSFYTMTREKKSYLLRVRRLDPQGNEFFSVIVLDLK